MSDIDIRTKINAILETARMPAKRREEVLDALMTEIIDPLVAGKYKSGPGRIGATVMTREGAGGTQKPRNL